uniref:Uncharacterized protein n=1 Tax=Acrobeloides nanus TaxID=290746 RepID=A0A914C8Q1_9BILA
MNNPIEEFREMNLQDVYTKMQLIDEEFDDCFIAMGLLHGSQFCDHCGNRMASDLRNVDGSATRTSAGSLILSPRKVYMPVPSSKKRYFQGRRFFSFPIFRSKNMARSISLNMK